MGAEAGVADPVTLPPRAEIARLTLQVRAAVRRADDAERAAAEAPADTAAAVLRDRLAGLLAERRAALANERREVEREAAELVEAARAQGAEIRARHALAEPNTPSTAPSVVVAAAPVVAPGPAPELASAAAAVGPDLQPEAKRPAVESRSVAQPPAPVAPAAAVAAASHPEVAVSAGVEPPIPEAVVMAVPMVAVPLAAPIGPGEIWARSVPPLPEAPAGWPPAPPVLPLALASVSGGHVEVGEAPSSTTPPGVIVTVPPVPPVAPAAPPRLPVAPPTEATHLPEPRVLPVLVPPPSPWAAPSAGPAEPATARPVTVMIDPESFGQAVAAAIAAVLAERPEALSPRPAAGQWVQAVPVGAPQKKSFWSGLWHADVVLAVLAMAIILVILLAWSV